LVVDDVVVVDVVVVDMVVDTIDDHVASVRTID